MTLNCSTLDNVNKEGARWRATSRSVPSLHSHGALADSPGQCRGSGRVHPAPANIERRAAPGNATAGSPSGSFSRRLESFYQKLIGELRMGMVLVDRGHDDPGRLVPAHRRLYQLLSAGKLKQCAALLAQHLDDSESRLSRIMGGHNSGTNGKQKI